MTDKERETLAVLQTAHESEVMMQAKIDRLVGALERIKTIARNPTYPGNNLRDILTIIATLKDKP